MMEVAKANLKGLATFETVFLSVNIRSMQFLCLDLNQVGVLIILNKVLLSIKDESIWLVVSILKSPQRNRFLL